MVCLCHGSDWCAQGYNTNTLVACMCSASPSSITSKENVVASTTTCTRPAFALMLSFTTARSDHKREGRGKEGRDAAPAHEYGKTNADAAHPTGGKPEPPTLHNGRSQ